MVLQGNSYHVAATHADQAAKATLGFIAEARHLAVITGSAEGPVTYDSWDDQRRALRGLVRRLEGED